MRPLRVVMRALATGHTPLHSLGRAGLAGAGVWMIAPLLVLLANLTRWDAALFWAVVTGCFVLPAILLVLWPIDYWLPRTSRLWHPGWMTVIGLVGGTAFFFIIAIVSHALNYRPSLEEIIWMLMSSTACGGSYGMFMGLALACFNSKCS